MDVTVTTLDVDTVQADVILKLLEAGGYYVSVVQVVDRYSDSFGPASIAFGSSDAKILHETTVEPELKPTLNPWTEDADYPSSEWMKDVAANNTRRSYRDWVDYQRENRE